MFDVALGVSFLDPGPRFAPNESFQRAILSQLIPAAGSKARAYVLRDDATATYLLYTVVPAPELTPGWILAFQQGKRERVLELSGTILRAEANESERYARLDHRDKDGGTILSFTRFVPGDHGSSQIASMSVGGSLAETLA